MTRRTSLNLSPDAEKFVREAAEKRGVTMGEVVRHALSLEKYVTEQVSQGSKLLIQTKDNKLKELVTL